MASSGGWIRTSVATGLLTLSAAASGTPASAAAITAADATARLSAMHPDHETWIASVRAEEGRAEGVTYAGLVRPSGTDPADEDDAPIRGAGVRNDLVIFPATLAAPHSPAWLDVILDHEYFHARHLSRGFPIPLVSFGNERADRHYLEALAWGWVVKRIDDGLHDGLGPKERAEVQAAYERHLDGFRKFIMARQPEAWAHYGRYFPGQDPELKLLAAAP